MKKTNQVGIVARSKVGRVWVVVALFLFLIAMAYLALGGASRPAIAAILADPMSVFAARSPGQRRAGALAQTKARYASRAVAPGASPSERVLAGVRSRPGAPAVFDALPDAPGAAGPAPGAAPVEPFASGLGVPFAEAGFPNALAGAPGFGLVSDTPAPGGGANAVPGSGGGATPAPAVAVPEPMTWLTMLVGFLAIGAILRVRIRTGAGIATTFGGTR